MVKVVSSRFAGLISGAVGIADTGGGSQSGFAAVISRFWTSVCGHVMQQRVVVGGCNNRLDELGSATMASLTDLTLTVRFTIGCATGGSRFCA
ncbi:hypothetical protein C1H46_012393 [Malus baccata]|uniref:Uncharacterized protein n=1 Tax=Malus baccata TaxID=106549 RepID=A0A540MT48_MALBA|nr:hypothetical protein C1H46_012393 [Malus baccata]